MAEPLTAPSFATLLQRYFADHLTRHRAASPRTIAAYRDTFRLLLLFAEQHIGKAPTSVVLILKLAHGDSLRDSPTRC